MAFAQGSRSRLAGVVESSFGATPTSPNMTVFPYKRHSLDLRKDLLSGQDIQPDRIPRVSRHGNRRVAGNIEVDLRADVYDDLIESAFFGAFTTAGVLMPGTAPSFLTLEDAALDISEFRQFVGCAVSQMSLRYRPNTMVETTFEIVGQDLTQSATSLDATPTAAAADEPFDSYTGSITEGGSSIAIVTGIELQIVNSLAPTFVVGSDVSPQLEFGRSVVTGTLTAYYEDEVLLNRFLNEAETSLVFAMQAGTTGDTYTWTLPRVKVNGASVPVSNPQSRVISLPFEALYDTSEGTHLKLEKS